MMRNVAPRDIGIIGVRAEQALTTNTYYVDGLRCNYIRYFDRSFPAIHAGALPRPVQVAPVSGS